MSYNIEKELEALQKIYFSAIDEAFKAKTVLGETNFEEMREDLMNRYRIERDQLKEKAKILDKNINFETNLKIYELTPHRCGFLWIFKNEARKLKEREVSAEDRIELDGRTFNVEMLEDKIYAEPDPPDEKKRHWWERLFKRLKHSDKPVDDEHSSTEQQEPAAMENISTPETAFTPPSATSDSAHGASDDKLQSDKKAAEKPNRVSQLKGQIAMDELSENK